jgi:DNA-directed RNA polymerase subunit M/transcription elongation factor TFIIS
MISSARARGTVPPLPECRVRVLHALSAAVCRAQVSVEDARDPATVYEAALLALALVQPTPAAVVGAYVHAADRVVYNMQQNAAFILAHLLPSAACTASHRHLAENTQRAQRDEAVERDLAALYDESANEEARFQALATSVQVDTALRCPSCHRQDGITRTMVQMNAGDEGMKTCCTCANCNFNWKMG